MTTTYVTACFNNTEKLEYLYEFLKLGLPTILFSAPTIEVRSHDNLTIIETDFCDLPFAKMFNETTTILPSQRDPTIDSYKHLVLLNSKIHFLYSVANASAAQTLAWIDLDLIQYLKPSTLSKLKTVRVQPNKILVPGNALLHLIDLNRLCKRFNCSLFFGSREAINTLHTANLNVQKSLSNSNLISWDSNLLALIEFQKPSLFQVYPCTNNDEILNFPEKRVILNLMIKNEEKIIRRCLTNVLSIVDAVCISDTGSTDDTLNILETFLPTLLVPYKVANHTWSNFGHNRTLSFNETRQFCSELGWAPESTYGLLLDADMNFVHTEKFDKQALSEMGYLLLQKSPSLEYYNTRLVNLSYPWSCKGYTHEYWHGTNCTQLDTLWINDIGDGGSKSTKFIRDEELLRRGLQDEPKNERYMFYLAQTLRDLNKIPESIEMYKERIKAGSWAEEVWYSMYSISKLYYQLNNLLEMEYWALKAYEQNKNRAENLYFLVKVFREKGQNYKAWHYLMLGINKAKPKELLFIEPEVYKFLFLYEKTILNYYIQPHKPDESLKDMIDYLNLTGGTSYPNLQFYVLPIKSRKITSLLFPNMDDYKASSTSIIKENNQYRINIRYVNYTLRSDGSYTVKDGDVINSRNFTCMLNENFSRISPITEIPIGFPAKHITNVRGLEDVRLYFNKKQIMWVATSKEYSDDGDLKILIGDYDNAGFLNAVSVKAHKQTSCEKNWIPIKDNTFIYGWSPYTVGIVKGSQFEPTLTQELPRFFENVRGSSNVVEYNDALYTLTHIVIYGSPRKYYHVLVKINSVSNLVMAYSLPFYFKNNSVEYCLGIEIKKNTLYAIVSQNDCDPIFVEANLDDIKLINI